MGRGTVLVRLSPFCALPKPPLSRLRGGLFGCGSPTVTVSFRLRVGVCAAGDPFAMDILLDDYVAFPVNLPVDRGFAVIAVGSWRNGRDCRAGAGDRRRRNYHRPGGGGGTAG